MGRRGSCRAAHPGKTGSAGASPASHPQKPDRTSDVVDQTREVWCWRALRSRLSSSRRRCCWASRSRPCDASPCGVRSARTACGSGGPPPGSTRRHAPVTSPQARSPEWMNRWKEPHIPRDCLQATGPFRSGPFPSDPAASSDGSGSPCGGPSRPGRRPATGAGAAMPRPALAQARRFLGSSLPSGTGRIHLRPGCHLS